MNNLLMRPVKSESNNSILNVLYSFFDEINNRDIEIYNEFSFQHELGLHLRNAMPKHKVQFERNVSFFLGNRPDTIKKEIDIAVFSPYFSEKYAIELKAPNNGRHPEGMYDFVKDIRFMEQLKNEGFTNTYAITLVFDRLFYQGPENTGIYSYFRKEHSVYGKIFKPTGEKKNIDYIILDNNYEIRWITLDERRKFYIIEI